MTEPKQGIGRHFPIRHLRGGLPVSQNVGLLLQSYMKLHETGFRNLGVMNHDKGELRRVEPERAEQEILCQGEILTVAGPPIHQFGQRRPVIRHPIGFYVGA